MDKLSKGFIAFAILLLVLMRPGHLYAATATINPSADAYVFSSSPTFNSGKAINMIILSNPGLSSYADMLIKFPLDAIPVNATINSARLELYLVSGAGQGKSVEIAARPASGMWDEGVNWNEGINQANWGGASSSIDKTPGIKTWDVTEMVRAWKSGTRNNEGMILTIISLVKQGDIESRIFRADESENENERPRLVVDYSLPSQIPQLQLQPGAGRVAVNQDALVQNGGSNAEEGAVLEERAGESETDSQADGSEGREDKNSPLERESSVENGSIEEDIRNDTADEKEGEKKLATNTMIDSIANVYTGALLIIIGVLASILAFVMYERLRRLQKGNEGREEKKDEKDNNN